MPETKFHTHAKLTQNYSFVYLNFYVFDSRYEDKKFLTECYQALPELSPLIISSWIKAWFIIVIPKYLNCNTYSKDLLGVQVQG
jgi:hypothetical protein